MASRARDTVKSSKVEFTSRTVEIQHLNGLNEGVEEFGAQLDCLNIISDTESPTPAPPSLPPAGVASSLNTRIWRTKKKLRCNSDHFSHLSLFLHFSFPGSAKKEKWVRRSITQTLQNSSWGSRSRLAWGSAVGRFFEQVLGFGALEQRCGILRHGKSQVRLLRDSFFFVIL